MASGTLNGSQVSISGYGGSYMFVNWQLASQNIAGNYSTINWQAYFHFQGADAELDAGSVGSNVGTLWNNGGRVYNYSGNFSARNLGLASGSFNIGHNSDGTQSLNLSCSIAVYQSGTSSGSEWWGLPTIPRYASINSWGFNWASDTVISVYVNVSNTCDLVDYQINGGGWVRGYTGSYGSTSFNIGGLVPGTSYSIAIRVQRSDSGLYTYSGAQSDTTDTVKVSSFTITNTFDTGFQLNVATNYTCDEWQYRLNGGSWVTVTSGAFTSTNTTVTGLASDTAYTVDVQARDQASQTWTAIVTQSATTQYPTPLQPTNLSPGNGSGVSSLTPALSWQFNSTSPDGQGSYEVIIYKQSDGSTVWDSGQVTSGTSSAQVPTSLLAWDAQYQWKVTTWSDHGIAGVYSSLALFKTSQAPTVTITSPAEDGVVTTDAPDILWTYSDPQSEAQTSFTVEVQLIQESGQTAGAAVFQQTITNSAATQYTLPGGTLQNGSLYIVTVSATNGDGVAGVSAITQFSVVFVAPSPPNIDLSLSEDSIYEFATVSTNTPANNGYDADDIRLYKRIKGATAWNLIGTVQVSPSFIDPFDDTSAWVLSGVASGIGLGTIYRQNGASASLETSGPGTAIFDKVSTIGSISGYSKMRLWIYPNETNGFISIEFKLGADSTNYYSFTVEAASLVAQEWNSIEVDINALSTTGSPTQGNIQWQEIDIASLAAIASDDLLIDAWRLVPIADSLFLYDYELANNTVYEYAATAYSAEWNLESAMAEYGSDVSIVYGDFKNTYLIPVNNESNSVVANMNGSDVPSWTENVPTSYYTPVGATVPVSFSLGTQQYRTGTLVLSFYDSDKNIGFNGLADVQSLKAIMNDKPIMLRTWWGEIIYISIDGTIVPTRIPGVGWSVSVNFTEIASE